MNTRLLHKPWVRELYLPFEAITRLIPDELYLKLIYRIRMGKKLNLKEPQTYNEKLQWIKLYDRKPIYTTMVDKYEVKKYVADIIGEQYIIPTLGVWNHFDEIDFTTLPDQFVLKCTHDSGGLVIVKDKDSFDRKAARKKIEQSLKRNFYWKGREWPYKAVKPRIIAEKYIEDSMSHDLKDYKIFTFNGAVKMLFIATERNDINSETKFDFFDSEFNNLPFTNGHPNACKMPNKPEKFDTMKMLAEKLSAGIPQLRVDFYEVNGNVLFGELTLFHWSGMEPFDPPSWDRIIGDWIELPKDNNT